MTSHAAVARTLAVAAFLPSLAACASTDPAVDIVNGKTGDHVYMPSSRTSLGVSAAGSQPYGTSIGATQPVRATPPPGSSRALDPDSPWAGEVGVSHSAIDRTELGLGLAIPNTYLSSFRPVEQPDRVRSLGLGVWWKYEF